MKRASTSAGLIPLGLLVICLVSYAPLIPWLGFFWDDWPAIWFYHSIGPGGFSEVFAVDRPLLAWIYSVTTSIMGESITAWQLFAILTRWLSGLAFLWFLKLLFPSQKRLAVIASILFVLFPSFLQQYISVTYGNLYIYITAFILSLGLMVLAARNFLRYWMLGIASLLLSSIVIFSVEYFSGLELLRPIILWLVFSKVNSSRHKKLKRTLIFWFPYFAVLVVFLIYNILFRETPRAEIQLFSNLAENPFSTVINLLFRIFEDIVEVLIVAWLKIFDIREWIRFDILELVLPFLISIIAAGATFLFVRKAPQDENIQEQTSGVGQNKEINNIIFLGSAALLLGGWPFWVTNLQMKLRFPLDRLTLPMIFGASLLTAGIIGLFYKSNTTRAGAIGILAGIAIWIHVLTGINYVREWEVQKSFFWQLTWRAPAIEYGTVLITPELPFTYFSDNSLTAPLNWIYDPNNNSTNLEYLILDLESRLDKEITDFNPDNQIEHFYRAKSFSGSMENSIYFQFNPPQCLRIYNSEYEYPLPESKYHVQEALSLSNTERILFFTENPAIPPDQIFGNKPELNWCYYYQKAELARQTARWDEVAILGDQAETLINSLNSKNANELIPFIEGYGFSGQIDKSGKLSILGLKLNPEIKPLLCKTWDRIGKNSNLVENYQEDFFQIYYDLGCESG